MMTCIDDAFWYCYRTLRRLFDRRQLKWFYQRLTRGFDDRELWDLNLTMAKFVLPRLKAFRSCTRCHPCHLTERQWHAELDTMVEAFELLNSHDRLSLSDSDSQKVRRGLRLLACRFETLWY
jgi:hypothetical protein